MVQNSFFTRIHLEKETANYQEKRKLRGGIKKRSAQNGVS
jgi:hypothetical protein